MKVPSPPQGEFAHGWPVLAACLLGQMLGVHTLPVYTAGLFVTPLHDALGWDRAAVSAGVMIMTVLNAVMAPLIGRLTLRFDSRLMVLSGMVVLAAGYGMLSHIAGSVVSFWGLLAVIAVAGAGSSSVTLTRVLVARFARRRGAALGIALLGTGLTSVAGPLLVGAVMAEEGWRAAYLAIALAVTAGAAVMGGLFLLRRTEPSLAREERMPRPLPVAPGRLLSAFFLIALGSGGAVIHFVPMLQDLGWSTLAASRGAALLGLSLVVSRLLTGVALDRCDPLRLGAGLMTVAAMGFALMGLAHGGWMLLLAPVIGLSLGAELDLMPYLAARAVGVQDFGQAYGRFYGVFVVGAGLSTMAYALLEKLGGDYRLAFAWSALLVGCGGALLAPARRTDSPVPAFSGRR